MIFFVNLVNFGPVTPVFNFAKDVHSEVSFFMPSLTEVGDIQLQLTTYLSTPTVFHACIVLQNKAVIDSRLLLCQQCGIACLSICLFKVSLVNAKLTSPSYVYHYIFLFSAMYTLAIVTPTTEFFSILFFALIVHLQRKCNIG